MNVHAPALANAQPFDEQTAAFAGDVIASMMKKYEEQYGKKKKN